MRKTPASFSGYTYLEILVALLVFSVALVPAVEAIQAALHAVRQDARQGADGTERNVTDGQAAINKMERLLAQSPADLKKDIPANPHTPHIPHTPHATLSDAADVVPRCLVYTSWYKPEVEQENARYVDTKTHLLWIKVSIEGSGVSATSLVLVP